MSVAAPVEVPCKSTFAPIRGSPEALSVIRPDIFPVTPAINEENK